MNKLQQWFTNLYDEFEDDVPKPEAFESVVQAVEGAFGARPVKYLGAGDNGIAFLADDGDIIKFTIDKNEALLWHRLKSKNQTGITHLKEIANLVSSKTGESYVYVLKAEFAPNPVTPEQARLIRGATKAARENTERDMQKLGPKKTKEIYRNRRTFNFVKEFQKIADIDPDFEEIPTLLMDLADKHKGHIFDIQPDNFRRNVENKVILVDPSVPDLSGDIEQPEAIVYESKLDLALSCRVIYF